MMLTKNLYKLKEIVKDIVLPLMPQTNISIIDHLVTVCCAAHAEIDDNDLYEVIEQIIVHNRLASLGFEIENTGGFSFIKQYDNDNGTWHNEIMKETTK